MIERWAAWLAYKRAAREYDRLLALPASVETEEGFRRLQDAHQRYVEAKWRLQVS